jgi:hypothetical protein
METLTTSATHPQAPQDVHLSSARLTDGDAILQASSRQPQSSKLLHQATGKPVTLNEKGLRQLEVVQYQRHCAGDYKQAQGAASCVKNKDNRNISVEIF